MDLILNVSVYKFEQFQFLQWTFLLFSDMSLTDQSHQQVNQRWTFSPAAALNWSWGDEFSGEHLVLRCVPVVTLSPQLCSWQQAAATWFCKLRNRAWAVWTLQNFTLQAETERSHGSHLIISAGKLLLTGGDSQDSCCCLGKYNYTFYLKHNIIQYDL